MCVNKVFVRDLYRNTGSYYDCGRCPACLQTRAGRRARLIRATHPKGKVCYFVTLTYDNKSIPYIRFSDYLKFKKYNSFVLPIHRDVSFVPFKGWIRKHQIIGCSDPIDSAFQLLHCSFIRKKTSKGFEYVDDKISVAFNADAQNYLKRLRQILLRDFGYTGNITYYYAPEYGPTTQRFHIHLLLWFDSSFDTSKVRFACSKAWPFANCLTQEKFCQLAICPSDYLASYVNCDTTVSKFITRNFPLRCSHSLGFGFDEDIQSLPNIIQAYKNGRFSYTVSYSRRDGTPVKLDLLYPRYIINRYFPKVKGYCRLDVSTLRHLYQDPFKYLRFTFYSREITKRDFITNKDGTCQFPTALIDRYGMPVYMTCNELSYNLRIIHKARCYYDFYRIKYNDYSLGSFADFILDYHMRRSLYLYKESQTEHDMFESVQSFMNLNQLLGVVRNYTVEDLIGDYNIEIDPNKFYSELKRTLYLEEKYKRNIKQRKVNTL